VFQTPVLLPWRTIIDNVLLPADVLKLDRAASRERARSLLDMVGLSGFEEKYPRELSGGMQQRASIARALLHEPQVLLMDEPFGALDAMTRETMNRELLKIWEAAGKTIVLVTHSISEAVFLSNRVIVLTQRPGTIAEIVDIDLPYPRQIDDLASDAFGRYIRRIRRHFVSG
jgi:NitT/TauT family transport system ATP-binding protein